MPEGTDHPRSESRQIKEDFGSLPFLLVGKMWGEPHFEDWQYASKGVEYP